ALSFDDGPHTDVTPRILKTLKNHQAKATFYMLGNQVDYYPSLVKEVLNDGHEIGNHSKSHKDLTHLSSEQIRKEIQSTNQSIQEASGGYLPKSLRPPYGAVNDSVEDFAGEFKLPIVMWSVDSLDWKSRNPEAINQEVMANIHPGAIVLLHDIHPTTADALPTLLTNLENEGYEFVTVSQLLEFAELEGFGPHYRIHIDEEN
ncbi:MAG: polysaccharide deacetylase family protein, partial [Atopostipes sp.]|nr:polysaccharide deacetylase family protein [Atopostipes sp.]